ncbi:hypothetical protein [Leptolyngbya sp. FACHB-261]|uniref:hypothetical protein n=1 Tax=Leptolyngbya sp. FACHB-261 TaxID=2692806 RepID=UPI0016858883|nr:hypothetical protein [Leptolyngbya sp. FACHB-261]MBD2102265.1 hypothetical protein [Leptolyngbya sp. FACHB-261]
MTLGSISAHLSDEQLQAVIAEVEIIREKMPFLVGLTREERRQLSKLGQKSRAFVHDAVALAAQNPSLIPGCIDVAEMRRDLELFEALSTILMSLNQLQELVEGTQMLVGSEAYAAARLTYNSAKATGKRLGLDSAVNKMGQRFRKSTKAQAEVEAD